MNFEQLSLNDLEKRRRQIGMSLAALAKRSGVSLPTVQRILSGRHPAPTLPNVFAIADTLGMQLKLDPKKEVEDILEHRARQLAEQLVGLVQGTAALEGQAVGARARQCLVQRTVHELLAGSRRRLWSDE